MRLRLTEIDRPLTAVVVALAAYGLATLYSAGQTDVPTFVTTIWQRQLIWLGVGLVAIVLMFRTSPRLLEWATPYAYGIGVVVLLLTLATGTGAGTAASERSWIAIGGVRLGRRADVARRQATGSGKRHRVHCDPVRDAVLGRHEALPAGATRVAGHRPGARLLDGGLGRLDHRAARPAALVAAIRDPGAPGHRR